MDNVCCWLTHTQMRVYKGSLPSGARSLRLDLGQGDRGSFQACIRMNSGEPVKLGIELDAPSEYEVRVRRVGYIPLPHFNSGTPEDELDGIGHIPGFAPDPLYDDLEILLPRNESQSYWISVRTSRETPAGTYPLKVRFFLGEGDKRAEVGSLTAYVHVHPLVIEPVEDFHVMHWFYVDALCDWYGARPFDETFWDICRPYMKNLLAHGNNVIFTPIFTPPVNGLKRPTQLLKVRRGGRDEEGRELYSFDWSDVKRWVDEAKSCGFGYFQWSHLFSQWGAKHAIRIFENYDGSYGEGRQLWPIETAGSDPVYYNFLRQFFPEFKGFLEKEGILNRSFHHLSDEPFGEEALVNYRKGRAIIKELAPWIKTVVDAVNHVNYGKEDMADIPISGLGASLEFMKLGVLRWDYFCCGPRGRFLNRLMDTILPKIRGSAWLFYALKAVGFGHWGYNYWYKMNTMEMIDPFTVFDGTEWPMLPYGDPFVVYPGERGPIDSIRWEVFGESMADYALLRTRGIDPDHPMLKDIKSYEDFPKDHAWYQAARLALLTGGY